MEPQRKNPFIKIPRLIAFKLLLTIAFMLPHGGVHAQSGPEIYELSAKEIMLYADSLEGRKVIFIYATWCPHCRKALPNVMKMAAAKPDSVVAVSVDKSTDDVRRYYDSIDKMPAYPLIRLHDRDPRALELYLNVAPRKGVPHFILLDEKGGVFKSKNMHPEDAALYLGVDIAD